MMREAEVPEAQSTSHPELELQLYLCLVTAGSLEGGNLTEHPMLVVPRAMMAFVNLLWEVGVP